MVKLNLCNLDVANKVQNISNQIGNEKVSTTEY
jgi:hypothetical protein